MNESTENRRRVCPQCGWSNAEDASFCSGCGRPLQSGEGAERADELRDRPLPPEQFSPDAPIGTDRISEIPTEELTRLVGRNADYYLPLFERMSRLKSYGKFNFFAFLFGGGWMLYRKQYLTGALTAAIQLLLQGLSLVMGYLYTLPVAEQIYKTVGITVSQGMLTPEQSNAMTEELSRLPAGTVFLSFSPALLALAGLILSLVIGACANRWYYRHVLRTAREIRSAGLSPEKRSEELERRGGVNLGLSVCLLICWVILNRYGGTIVVALFS